MLSIIVALIMRTKIYMQYFPKRNLFFFSNVLDFLPCFGPEALTFREGII